MFPEMRGGSLLFPAYLGQQKSPCLNILANQVLDIIGERSVFLPGCLDSEYLQPGIQTESGENLGNTLSVHACTLSVIHQKRKDQNDKNL